jgi:zinc protease
VAGQGGEPPIRVVSREKAQAAVAMVFPGVARRHPDRAAMQVWAAVASGLGGRLFEALRDRRSLAYTVVASAWLKARAGALVTYIATSPEREAEAREAMLRELERFTREAVSMTELRQAVNYLAGQAEVSRQSGSAVAAEILEAWVAGSGLAELEDPGAAYRGVTAEDVLRVAAASLNPSQRVEGVVRGTGVGRPPVAALQS